MLPVERDALERRSEIAHRPVERLNRDLANLAGADDAALGIRPGPLIAVGSNVAVLVPDDLDRLRVEVQVQPTRCGAGRRCAPFLQDLVDHHDLLIAGDGVLRRLVVVEVLVVEHHVDVIQFAAGGVRAG